MAHGGSPVLLHAQETSGDRATTGRGHLVCLCALGAFAVGAGSIRPILAVLARLNVRIDGNSRALAMNRALHQPFAAASGIAAIDDGAKMKAIALAHRLLSIGSLLFIPEAAVGFRDGWRYVDAAAKLKKPAKHRQTGAAAILAWAGAAAGFCHWVITICMRTLLTGFDAMQGGPCGMRVCSDAH